MNTNRTLSLNAAIRSVQGGRTYPSVNQRRALEQKLNRAGDAFPGDIVDLLLSGAEKGRNILSNAGIVT